MWLKKKSVLQADGNYDTEKSADGTTDLRTTYSGYSNYNINYDLPSDADAGNYFYLPVLGWYADGRLVEVGRVGYYWPSTAYQWVDAWGGTITYVLRIASGSITLSDSYCSNGMRGDWPE